MPHPAGWLSYRVGELSSDGTWKDAELVGVGIFVLLLALVLAGLGSADQRALWWRFQARRFRDPAANEPSDSAFRSQRIMVLLCAAFLVGTAIWTFSLAAEM